MDVIVDALCNAGLALAMTAPRVGCVVTGKSSNDVEACVRWNRTPHWCLVTRATYAAMHCKGRSAHRAFKGPLQGCLCRSTAAVQMPKALPALTASAQMQTQNVWRKMVLTAACSVCVQWVRKCVGLTMSYAALQPPRYVSSAAPSVVQRTLCAEMSVAVDRLRSAAWTSAAACPSASALILELCSAVVYAARQERFARAAHAAALQGRLVAQAVSPAATATAVVVMTHALVDGFALTPLQRGIPVSGHKAREGCAAQLVAKPADPVPQESTPAA